MSQKSDVFHAGDEIEVLSTWAHGSQRWAKGYSFLRYDGSSVILRIQNGVFKGNDVRYSLTHVRSAI